MKKSLVILILLALCSGAGIAAVHTAVSDTAEQVTLTEAAHLGDSAAAEGVEISFSCEQGNQLFWNTTLVPNRHTDTVFRFTPAPEYSLPRGIQSDSFYISSLLSDVGYTFDGDSGADSDEFGAMTPIVTAVSARTKPGTVHTEVLCTRDFLPILPLEAQINLLDRHSYLAQGASELTRHIYEIGIDDPRAQEDLDFLNALDRAFRFPTPADHRLMVQLAKDSAGELREVSFYSGAPEPVPADRPFTESPGGEALEDAAVPFSPAAIDVRCLSTQIGNSLYFIPELRQENGKLLDYSLTAGYGLYRMERIGDRYSLESLSLVYPLEPDQHVESLLPDAGGTRLLVAVSRDGRETLHILHPDTGVELQSFPVGLSDSEKNWLSYLTADSLLMAMQNQDRFQLFVQEESGDYHLAFAGEFPDGPQFPKSASFHDYALAFDGSRLAMATRSGHHSTDNNGILLMVWDKTGLLYAGDYRSSLDRSPVSDSSGLYSPISQMLKIPMNLQFTS